MLKSRVRNILIVIHAIMILGGCGSRETLAEVEFEKSRFGLEYIPDRSLEGYNEKYHPFFQPAGSQVRKYLFEPNDGFLFSNFPKKPSLLDGIDVMVVDTVARTYEKYDRTEALTTLYIDPKIIDRASWQTLSRFVNDSYSQPDSANRLIRWLNHGYNLDESSDSLMIFNTIYALVYTDLAALEPEYVSANGKRFIKVGVDLGIYFKDGAEPWLHTGRVIDSVFYYWPGRAEMLSEFGEYERNGVKFKALYRTTQADN